jgi:hypothetical protein
MQELSNSSKRPNLRIMGIEVGEEMQVKGIYNIFSEIITENFPNLKKVCPFRYRKPPGHQTKLTKIEPLHSMLSLKHLSQTTDKHRERILKAVGEKIQIMYEGKPIKITAHFSTENLKARREWNEVFQAINENNFNVRYSTQQNYHSKLMEK